jgi:hypothetical protein
MVGKIHIAIPTLRLKRFFREYIVAVCGTVFFVLVLVSILVSRYYALTGLGNLAKINPLITTDNNQLVARDKAYGAVAGQGTSESTPTTDTTQKSSPSNTGSSAQTTTPPSGQSSQPAPSSSTPPSQPTPQFTISIGTMTQTAGAPTGKLQGLNPICTITHQFTADVNGTNGPGTMTYTWVQSDGTVSPVQKLTFAAGASIEQATYQWKITSTSADYWVKLSATAPNATEKILNFRHQCII